MKSKRTPIRDALVLSSPLQSCVQDGLESMKDNHRDCIESSLRMDFADSIDIDEALRIGHDQENRWDYLLGYLPGALVVALEPHSAKQNEISTIIAKRSAALEQLRPHLKPGKQIAVWLWVASGKVHFADTEKARRQLDQHGIRFVGTKVMRKHLPVDTSR